MRLLAGQLGLLQLQGRAGLFLAQQVGVAQAQEQSQAVQVQVQQVEIQAVWGSRHCKIHMDRLED